MHSVKLTPGDFLKNAGNVGFLRLWEFICRDRGEEFKIVDEIPVEALPNEQELAQYIMNLYISEYAAESKVQKAFDKLDDLAKQISVETFFDDGNGKVKLIKGIEELLKVLKPTKPLKGDFISISGFAKQYDFYLGFYDKDGKVKEEVIKEDPVRIFKGLRTFCEHQKVKQAFLFREATSNLIDPFLQNKSFFDYSNNLGKNAESLIEKDFTQPFIQFGGAEVKPSTNGKRSKTSIKCISCSSIFAKPSKEKNLMTLAFVKGVIDDLKYKTSLFWNFMPDAYLCPICALIYLMAPLGFRQVGSSDFVFINSNVSLKTLWAHNAGRIDDLRNRRGQTEVNEDVGDMEEKSDTVIRRVDAALLKLLDDKSKILSNVQTVIRTKQENGSDYYYQFNIYDRDLLYLIHKERFPNSQIPFPSIRSCLERLAKYPAFNISDSSKSETLFNVYRHCLDNVLNYQNQYNLLNMLILESEEKKKSWIRVFLDPVFRIQCLQTYHMHKGEENDPMKNISKWQFQASKEGAAMRNILLADAVGRENVVGLASDRQEDIVRSVVYRLANALKTHNVEQFVDTLIRLYSSSKESIPTVFMTALRNEDAFPLVGYAYLLGLKGAFYQSKKSDEVEGSN